MKAFEILSKVVITNEVENQGLVPFLSSIPLFENIKNLFGSTCCFSESDFPAEFGGYVFYSYNVELVNSHPDAILEFTDCDDVVYVYIVDDSPC